MLLQYFFVFSVVLFPILFFAWKGFKKIFYKPYPNAVIHLREDQFYKQFEDQFTLRGIDASLGWKELIDKAWAARNFEIDLYWRRANYFWLFQVPAFAAYFALIKFDDENLLIRKPDEIFVIICLGIVFSTAWLLINKGSKLWQRHWEEYIDLIENRYYGPLYQTVNSDRSFSVSKINEIVSCSFIIVWVMLGSKFISDGGYFDSMCFQISSLNTLIAFSIYFTLLALWSMLFGYGRGYFKNR